MCLFFRWPMFAILTDYSDHIRHGKKLDTPIYLNDWYEMLLLQVRHSDVSHRIPLVLDLLPCEDAGLYRVAISENWCWSIAYSWITVNINIVNWLQSWDIRMWQSQNSSGFGFTSMWRCWAVPGCYQWESMLVDCLQLNDSKQKHCKLTAVYFMRHSNVTVTEFLWF